MNLEGKSAECAGFFANGQYIPCITGCTGMAEDSTEPQPEVDLAFLLRFTYTLDQLKQFDKDLSNLRRDPHLAEIRWVEPSLRNTKISDPEKYQQLMDQAAEIQRQTYAQVQEFLDKTGLVFTDTDDDGSALIDYIQHPLIGEIRSQIQDLYVDEPHSGEIVIFFGKDHPEYSITIPA